MRSEAIDGAIGSEPSSRDTHPRDRTPNDSRVKWTCRRKGSSVEVTVEVTYRIDAGPDTAAASTSEDFYDGDSGTISVVCR